MSVSEHSLRGNGTAAVTLGKPIRILVALGYGALLAGLPLLKLSDRMNYLAYPTDSFLLLAKYIVTGPLAVLSNAPLWLLLNGALGLMLSPEHALRLLIFVQAVAVAYVLLKAESKSWLLVILLLFIPEFIENFSIHLRQGMGITVFLLGWFSSSRVRRWLLIGASPFIHESFAFVVVLYVMTEVMKKLRLADDVKTTVIILVSIAMSLGLVVIAKFVGARQAAEYNLDATAVSGAAFIVWSAVLCLFLLERGDLGRNYDLSLAAVTFYLGAYFLIKPSGRIFESMLPLVFLCGLRLTNWRRIMFLWLTLTLAVLSWAVALGNPGHSFI